MFLSFYSFLLIIILSISKKIEMILNSNKYLNKAIAQVNAAFFVPLFQYH